MKSLVIFAIVICTTPLHSQLIDTLYPDWNGITGFFKTDTGFTLVTEDAYLHFLGKDGKIKRTKYIEPVNSSLNSVNNVFLPFGDQADSFFYASTYDNHCDYAENFRLNKIDWDGNVLSFQKLEEWYFSNGTIVFPDLPDMPLFFEHAGMQLKFYYNNDSIGVLEFSEYILETAISEEGHFAVLTRDSVYYYIWLSEIPTLKASKKFDEPFGWPGRMDYIGDKILLSAKNKLFLFDDQLNEIEVISFSDEIIRTMNLLGQHIELMTWKPGEFPLLEIYNDSLKLENEYPIGNNSLFPAAFHFADSILTIAGIEFYPEDKPAGALYQIDLKSSDAAIETDIALTKVHFINSESYDGDCYYEPVRENYMNGITIELTNTGKRRIDDVGLTAERTYCQGFCWYKDRLFYHELSDIQLLPGEKKEFFIDSAYFHSSRSDETIECLLAVFPDMRVDANHADNSFCFDVTTSVQEIRKQVLNIYPNPVNDVLYIDTEGDVKKAFVYATNGLKILESQLSDTNADVSNLKPGVYFIRVEFADGHRVTQRFIKL